MFFVNRHTKGQSQLAFDADQGFRVLLEEFLGVFPTLADAFVLIGVPGAALVDDFLGRGEIEQIAGLGDALAVDDVEFGLLEGRGDFILDDLDLGPVADGSWPSLIWAILRMSRRREL